VTMRSNDQLFFW